MTTVEDGDRRVLEAAAGISEAHGNLAKAGRRVADAELCEYPAEASDPKLPGPVLVDPGSLRRRTAALLTAAGGEALSDAAGRLAEWAAPAVAIADLEQQLDEWLPEGVVSPLAAGLTRRLLCDAAGLAATPWSDHAVSVAAVEDFARTALDLADDAELIDEDALMQAGAERSWAGRVDALSEACGFQRPFGRLAVRANRVSKSKAALLHLRRCASRHEIAEMTDLTAADVGAAFGTCESIIRTGRNRWAAHRDPRFALFARTAADLADDVGLIDEDRLRRTASNCGWADSVDDFIAYGGYVHLRGQLAVSDIHRARVVAALVHLGGSARIESVAETAGLSTDAVMSAAANCRTVTKTRDELRLVAQQLSLSAVAGACADDDGLVDVDAFRAAAAANGLKGSIDELASQCGLVPLFGSFALKKNTAAEVKAALVHLGRPAAAGEIAGLIKRTPKAVTHALTNSDTIVRVKPHGWAVDTDGQLGEFAAAAAACSDDVGLIDEQRLRYITNQRWPGRFDSLTAACGFERVAGRLAAADTAKTAVRAALLNFGRPATSREIADATGLNIGRAATVLSTITSVVLVRPSVWAESGGVFARFAAALRLCRDDVGLIDETRLRVIAGEQGWEMSVDELIDVCGLPRLHGSLAMADTAPAAGKAALLALGRPATLHELATITKQAYHNLRNGLERCESVQRITPGTREGAGLLAVREKETNPDPPPIQ